jgi:site-specific recombinase XerD
VARTSGFHPGNRGSIPLWTTTLQTEAYPTVGLLSLYQQHIDHMVQLTGTEYAYNTVRRYKSSLNSLKRFMNFNDIELSKLGYEFVRDYYTYLLTIECLQPNSAFKNIKGLYRVIHIALDKKLLTANPFKDFHTRYKQPIRPYLTEVEVNSLLNHKFTTPRHNTARDLFLFQVYTGLAYIDIIKLTAKNIEVGLDGKQWIITVRHKTGTSVMSIVN